MGDLRIACAPVGLLATNCYILSVDGRGMTDLQKGDQVVVKKSNYKLLMAHMGLKSFYETAFEKLGERE